MSRQSLLLFHLHFTTILFVGTVSAFIPLTHDVVVVRVDNRRVHDQVLAFSARSDLSVSPVRLDLFPFRRNHGTEDMESSSSSNTNNNNRRNHGHNPTNPTSMVSLHLQVNNNHNNVTEDTGKENLPLTSAEELVIKERRLQLRQRVNQLARQMISPMPRAIAYVLRDATMDAVDMAVDEVLSRKSASTKHGSKSSATSRPGTSLSHANNDILSGITLDLVNSAFEPMEQSLKEMEVSLENARTALALAKSQASEAIQAVQAAALAQAEGAASVVIQAEEEAQRKVINQIYTAAQDVDDMEALRLEDIDFTASEMAPPFLDESSCLVPGEPVVRVEKAPENSRRIFAGIDIMASVDDVWNVLTQYDNLHNVVPNLVVNEVLETYDGLTDYRQVQIDTTKSDREQCQEMAQQMRGSLLKQVGGAKVAGINFSARTTLEVREWPQGLPDFAHFKDEMWNGKSRDARAKEYVQTKLARYQFPRPFAISSLPTKDISMQSIPNDDGEFRLYQGVWRMQPLPGCAGPGQSAMRLTYAVEISPRAYLPVQLVEGRIVKDLCNNLIAIRECVEAQKATQRGGASSSATLARAS